MNKTDITDALLTLYFLIRVVAVIVLSAFLLLKALVFRRSGAFGDGIAKSNVSVVVAFLGSLFLMVGLDFFATWPWALGVVLGVMFFAIRAAQRMADLYGGWLNLTHEAKLTLRDLRGEWRRLPLGMKIAVVILLLDLFAAVSLTEVKGVPPELALPKHSIQKQEDTP
jgi:hypothetical protein